MDVFVDVDLFMTSDRGQDFPTIKSARALAGKLFEELYQRCREIEIDRVRGEKRERERERFNSMFIVFSP